MKRKASWKLNFFIGEFIQCNRDSCCEHVTVDGGMLWSADPWVYYVSLCLFVCVYVCVRACARYQIRVPAKNHMCHVLIFIIHFSSKTSLMTGTIQALNLPEKCTFPSLAIYISYLLCSLVKINYFQQSS